MCGVYVHVAQSMLLSQGRFLPAVIVEIGGELMVNYERYDAKHDVAMTPRIGESSAFARYASISSRRNTRFPGLQVSDSLIVDKERCTVIRLDIGRKNGQSGQVQVQVRHVHRRKEWLHTDSKRVRSMQSARKRPRQDSRQATRQDTAKRLKREPSHPLKHEEPQEAEMSTDRVIEWMGEIGYHRGYELILSQFANEGIDGRTVRNWTHRELKYLGFVKMNDRSVILKFRDELFEL